MNIKRFRTMSRVISVLMKIFAMFSIALVIYGLYAVIFGDGNFWFTYNGPSIPLFSFGGSSEGIGITDAEEKLAAMNTVPPIVVVSSFILFKGSQIFSWLSKGETPFSKKFANAIKRLSLVLMISDLLIPVIYYSLLSLISVDGYNYTIGFGSNFIIGIILFIVSEIFKYGMELQHLADETV